jgi:ketopantoate reductase
MGKKFAIVGVGGRTGTLFAEELQRGAKVIGIGRATAARKLANGSIRVSVNGSKPSCVQFEAIPENEFNKSLGVDFVFLTTKNPVVPAVRYYYEKVDPNHIPDLVLSQNGFLASDEAYRELRKLLGNKAEAVRIIRIALFNAVSSVAEDEKTVVSYSKPVRLAFGVAYGEDNVLDLEEIFAKAGIEAYNVPKAHVKDMEYSKLFTNLIGMASFAHGKSIREGFMDYESFKDEVMALKEYARAIRGAGGRFLNFKHYPVGVLAFLFGKVPFGLLWLFKGTIGNAILKERGMREKGNIDEIDYYNGAVIKLGLKIGVDTPTNSKIYNMIKGRL